jgi:hypothetical protein
MFCLLSCSTALSVFICITGQLSRLEIFTKVNSIISPNRHHRLDVVFVLDPNSQRSTNLMLPHRELSYTESQVVVEFEKAGANVLFFDNRSQTDDPQVSATYVKQLNKVWMHKDARYQRAQNHFRQYEAFRRCNVQPSYDLYVRLREDTLVLSECRFSMLPVGIHVPRCNSWGGLNDRAAIVVGFANAKVYFHDILRYFDGFDSFFSATQRRSIRNPETFLAAVMTLTNVPIHIPCNTSLPFMSSHFDGNGRCATEMDRGRWSPNSPYDSCNRPIWEDCVLPRNIPSCQANMARKPTILAPRIR